MIKIEIYIAILGTITAVITIALTNYFVKANQLKLEERKLKEEYYVSFIRAVSESVISNHAEKRQNNTQR
ncbi:MAG: hypothetical protein RR954_08170 [Christensenellaceae bacterium]